MGTHGRLTVADANRILALAETDDNAALSEVADEIAPAADYLIEHDRAAAMRLVGALSGYWQDTGRVDEGRAVAERVLEGGHRAAAVDPEIAAVIPRALLTAAELAFRQGDQYQARKLARDTIRAAILIEDRVTASLAHTNLARASYREGNAAEVEKHARKALELAGNDTLARRGALHMLAWAAHSAGDLDEAERRFEKSLAYRREVAGGVSVAAEIANLGDLAAERGDLPRAATLLAEALELSHRSGSVYMLVNTLPSFAALAVRARRYEDAAQLFGAADAVANASGLVPDPAAHMTDARDTARDRLGEAEFATLMATGARLSSDDAVALCLEVARRIR